MIDPWKQPPEILHELLSFKDDNGRVIVTFGLMVTVYFEDAVSRRVREAVAELAEEYIEMVRPHLRWMVKIKDKVFTPLSSKRAKMPKALLPGHPDGRDWWIKYYGGETDRSASEFAVTAFGPAPLGDLGVGYFHVSFPLTWFAGRSETFPEYVVRLCNRLRPLSGYGGIGALEIVDSHEAEPFTPLVTALADRFPGMEVESRIAHTIALEAGIKGVNWLTILGDRWLNELDGREALMASLGEPFASYPYDGGLVIQAGSRPQLGDAEANNWPKDYVTLAKALKKIQVKEHGPFHYMGRGERMDTPERSMAWLFRFDGR